MQSRVLFNLFHRISDSIWNFWKFYQAQRQTPACILTIKFFQRNQLLVFFLGGLGLFLFSMKSKSEGVQALAGDKLRDILEKGTKTPIRGILTGT